MTTTTTLRSRSLSRSKAARGGFTLVEAAVSLAILSMVMLGVMNLFIAAARVQSRTIADSSAGKSAQLAVRAISDNAREALFVLLPTDTAGGYTFNQMLSTISTSGINVNSGNPATRFATYSQGNFESWDSGHANECYTGMAITFPAAGTACNILTGTGSTPTSPPVPYDLTQPAASYLFVYRSDKNGNTSPTTGSYLWEIGTLNGTTVDRPIVRNVDPYAWNAVEFVRVPDPADATGQTPLQDQVQVKVTCAEYSLPDKTQTSETTNGTNTTNMAGKVIVLRNYTASTGSGLSNATSTWVPPTGTSFQAS